MTDSENFAHVLDNFPEQFHEVAELGSDIKIKHNDFIAVCGMGGSGLPGEIAKSIVQSVPLILIKDYSLPSSVRGTVFVITYSGNTEETLELYEQAKEYGLEIVAITSGGELARRATLDKKKLIKVPIPNAGPSGFQPRMAVGYQTVPLMNVLSASGITPEKNWHNCGDFLDEQKKSIKIVAKRLAKEIGKRIPLIYSSEQFYAAAYKWKINFNENAKMHAFCNAFPGWNHNEINAHQQDEKFIVFMIRDKDDSSGVQQRMSITSKMLAEKGVVVRVIDSFGNARIERLFWTMYLGDWVSYYAAIERGVDPTPVTMVEGLKKRLHTDMA